MGFFKLVYYAITTTVITFLALNSVPVFQEFEPQPYTTKLLKFEGALAVNKKLDEGQFILKDEVLGPECMEVKDDEIYASLETGKIVVIKNDKISRTIADTSGRPLGLRFYNDDLYVTDIKKGLLKVDVKTGKVTVLVSTTEKIAGKHLNFADDLDILDGVIYFSDMTTKWKFHQFHYGVFEHDNSGRIYKHDLKTGKTEVLLEGLYFPNGVQISHDKKSLLFAETLKNRILRHHLSGPKKGRTEVFAELPGSPDNLRLGPRGTYWVAILNCRDVTFPSWSDRLGSYPKIRKALARLSHILAAVLDWANQYMSSSDISSISAELKSGQHFTLFEDTGHSGIVELDTDGKAIRSLHSSSPKLSPTTHAQEHNGYLYLGSYRNPYLVKIKL